MLYVKGKNDVKSESFCFLSDNTEHVIPMVYHTQELMMEYLKVSYPHISNVEYFTDGCAAQY